MLPVSGFRCQLSRPRRTLAALALAGLMLLSAQSAALRSAAAADAKPAPSLELKPGDRICLIGNTLAERMQHDGWLETMLQSRFPQHQLVLRNLGFSGDELVIRLRSKNFGSPDDHLTKHKTDVIFAFFGFNESFAGPAGLDNFKGELGKFIDHTLAAKYNGKSAPRLVLFSPIAHENLHDRNFPDGSKNNANIALYTQAMADVARAKGVVFVDLFAPTQALYAKAKAPLTINGIHLTAEGDRQLAETIDAALFSSDPSPSGRGQVRGPNEPDTSSPPPALEKLRQAVLAKDFIWFNRYRTVDGYSIYGDRADVKYVDGQTNRVVMDREMEILDLMTANRDKVVWAAAQGRELAADDRNLPPYIPVKTNKPGAGPNGEHIYLDGEEAIGKMTVHKALKVNLFASEKQFPELCNAVQMTFDPKGRLWVVVMPSYPHWKPDEVMNDKVLILEDTDHDGRADKCTTFADKLHVPTGIELWNNGVFVAQQPDLMFLQDTDGDDKADVRTARARRLRLSRYASRHEHLCARPRGHALFSGGHLSPYAGRDHRRPVAQHRRRLLPL